MARPSATKPTELELQILGILWANRECTVRQIHDRLVKLRGDSYGYGSTVKMLHVMMEKGMVSDDKSCRPKVYRPVPGKKKTQRSLLRDLVQQAYDGSSASVILQALSDRRISKEELAKIRAMIDQLEDQ